jgi:RNA polymerase sigma factor (sigma-70 family)
MSKATVYVVDDDNAVRDSLRWVLESAGYRVEPYDSAEKFLATYRPGTTGCLVLDVAMPGMSGLELQQRLTEHNEVLPIIFISAHGTVPTAVSAMRRGAVDFLMKPFNNHALLDRVGQAVTTSRKLLAIQVQRQALAKRLSALSPREREVLELVVAGQTNKEIARALGISDKTVETHRAQIMRKTSASSLAELVQLVTLHAEPPGKP